MSALGAALLTLLLVLLFLAYSLYTLPHWLTRLAARLNPRVLFFLDCKPFSKPRPKLIALTIDDSVDASITQQALAVLREHGAKATFFIIGQHCESREGKQLLEALVREGHELGNHTYLDRPSWKLDQQELKQEMMVVDELIQQACAAASGQVPPRCNKWFRPGHGFFTGAMLQTAEQLGYRTVLGNVYPHDPWVKSWRLHNPSCSFAASLPQVKSWRLNSFLVLHRVQPGSIVILHDGRPWLIPTLREVLPKLSARGYRVVTLSELTQQYA